MVKASAQYAVRRVIDGEDSYIMTLDNDAHVIPTDSFGLNGNYDGASTTLYIFKGIIDDTANWTITPNPSTGVEGSLDGNVYTISKVTNDNSKIEFVAKKGNLQLKKTMSVTLSKSGYDSTIVSVMSDVTSIKNDTLNKVMIPSVVNFTAQLHDKNGLYPSQKGYFVIYEQARSSLTIDEYTGLLKTTTTVADMEYVISDGQYPFVERYASVEPESSLSYPIMADDSLGVKVEFYKDLDRTIIWDRQTLPIVSDGVTTYTWRMYADDKFGNGMNAKPDGKRFMGISVNQTEKNPSNKISDYEWSPLYDNVKVGARNLIVTKTLTKGRYINDTTGSPASASTHSITDFIPASPNEDYTLSSIKKILNQVRVGYYSATKALISVVLYSGAQGYEKNLKTPTGTAFVRLSGDESTGAPLADWKFEKGNVSTDWSPAPEDFSSDISELSTAITALGETAIPALKDSVLNQTEKDAVKREMEKVSAEKTDVDSQYSTIYVNANLIGTPKTNLSSAKGAYDTAHTNLLSAIGNVLEIANDKPISRTLIDAVTTNLKNYSSAVATFRARVELANASIRDYQINQAKSAVSSEVAGVNTALGKVKDFTDTAFADGVIQRAEAKAIQNQLNTLKVENGDLANQYNIVHANPNLTGTAKSELNSAYTTATTGYNARYNSLVLAINTAIGDGKITTAEKTSVDTAFNNYNTALKTLTEKLNNALVNIGEKISQDKVDGLEIGGRNLIRNSAFNSGTTHWSINGVASVKTIDGKQAMLLTNTTSAGFYTSPVGLVGGSIYTFSYLAKAVGTTANVYFGFLNEASGRSTTQTVTNVWKRYTYTTTTPIVNENQLIHFYGNTNIGSGIYITDIKLEKGSKATDWTPAPEDIDADILNVSNATNSLKDFTNTAFVDGIISRAESQAIAEHLNTLNKEKSDLDNQYEVTYKNTNLAGVPKTNLLNAKSSYDTAHNNLISSINSAVSGNNTTPAQKKDVDDKFTAYTNAIKLLTQRFNEATLEISRKVSTDVSTGIADDKTGRNKWIVSRYPKSPAVIPVMADIRGLTPFETFVIDDFTDSLANTNTDNSTYHLSTYLYSNTAKNIVASIANDDTINVFLNGVSVYTKSVISGATNVTLPLVKGWNNIEVLLRTGTGNDYVRFATKLSSLVDDMSCYLGGGLSASQIRQISDEIDIRVQKGNVIASINASIEKDGSSALRLKGDKIQLNGNTEVDGNFKVNGDVLVDGTIKFNALNSGAQATINDKSTKTEAQGYAQTAVDGLEIGGRNLIIKKNALNDIESSSVGLSKWGYLLSNSSKSISLSLNSNEKYALSFLGHNEGSPQNVKIDLSGVENIQKTLSIGTGSNKYTWNFETPNLEGVGKKVYPFQTLDDWIRYYKNSPNLITDVNNTTYGKWGFSGVQLPNMAPVKGGMFGGAFPINGNLHGSVDSPATAWAGINLSKAYMETNDATLLPKIIAIGDYFVRNAIDIETWGVSFKAFPNNIEFNEVSNTWVANTRFIHTRTFYHVAWALLEIYDVTKDVRYSTLAGQLLDGATAYQLVATAQSNSGELPPYFAGSMYNTINRADGGYLPDWLTFTNTNGDVVMKATKKWIKLFGNTTRTSFDLYAWADVNYTVKSIADNYMNHLLYLYRNQGLRKSDGHKLLYCFSHYEWSDTPHSSGYMVPIPMNWDFINEEFGKEQWFTGDLMFWAIIGFAEAGETVIATALLDRYYELKSPDSEGRLLFYDRYTANGTPLVEDTSKSITFTALYMQARNILDNHNYDSEALLALKYYQKTSPYLTVDGGYSWDTEHSDALIENKSLGEVIYSIFENVSRVKPPIFLTFENTIPNPVYILDIKLETGNKHTDYTPAPEDVEEQIVAIETRVNNAELLITPEAITATVVESEDLTSKFQGYATQEALGNYLSNEDFSTEKENIMGEIDSRIGAIDYSPFVQATELEQKANAITAKISQAGGVNLIQNSIGWAGFDFWSKDFGVGTTVQDDELSSMGFGSAWYSNGTARQKQRINLPRSGTYTLSFWLKKTAGTSWAFVQVQKANDSTYANANAFAYAGYNGTRLTDGYELFTTTFEATELDVAVSITIDAGVEATITGIMLHEGSEPFKWQPYTSEVYNTNVKMDINGITVKNNQDAGYTLITPDEFSGYAPVDGTVERVFTLNGDTTEVKKLKAEQQFQMAPVTIITIDNSKYSGWAFI